VYPVENVSEGYKYITRHPGVRGGHAIIEKARVGVHDVIGLLQNGETVDSIVTRCFPNLRKAQIYECLAYYEDHRTEIDTLVSEQIAQTPEAHPLARKFDKLRALEDGWHDGGGFAPNKSKLDFIASKMTRYYPKSLLVPAIIPTTEGNLLFEWQAPGEPSVDLRLADLKAEFHAFDPAKGDIEEDFDLSNEEEWVRFLGFLERVIDSEKA
jgi:uncharacterized protein (DUF433 family)